MLFHRSGDKGVGTHGNSGLWLPDRDSHRIALVFYQTQLKSPKTAAAADVMQDAPSNSVACEAEEPASHSLT